MKVLVVAAHSDDEALGCGGTLFKHIKSGDDVRILFIADGVGSRGDDKNALDERQEITKDAMSKLGITDYHFLDFPDNKLDSVSLLDVVQKIESASKDFSPEIIYTHFNNDLNIDHRTVANAALTAFRPLPGSSVKKILMFEVLSSTEWNFVNGAQGFNPNYFVDISEVANDKLELLKSYELEMREAPHSRSFDNVSNLMKFRGNCIGVDAAEAFVLVRAIN